MFILFFRCVCENKLGVTALGGRMGYSPLAFALSVGLHLLKGCCGQAPEQWSSFACGS